MLLKSSLLLFLGEKRIGRKRKRECLDLHAWIALGGSLDKFLGLGFSNGEVGNLLPFCFLIVVVSLLKLVDNVCLLLCIVKNG